MIASAGAELRDGRYPRSVMHGTEHTGLRGPVAEARQHGLRAPFPFGSCISPTCRYWLSQGGHVDLNRAVASSLQSTK